MDLGAFQPEPSDPRLTGLDRALARAVDTVTGSHAHGLLSSTVDLSRVIPALTGGTSDCHWHSTGGKCGGVLRTWTRSLAQRHAHRRAHRTAPLAARRGIWPHGLRQLPSHCQCHWQLPAARHNGTGTARALVLRLGGGVAVVPGGPAPAPPGSVEIMARGVAKLKAVRAFVAGFKLLATRAA